MFSRRLRSKARRASCDFSALKFAQIVGQAQLIDRERHLLAYGQLATVFELLALSLYFQLKVFGKVVLKEDAVGEAALHDLVQSHCGVELRAGRV